MRSARARRLGWIAGSVAAASIAVAVFVRATRPSDTEPVAPATTAMVDSETPPDAATSEVATDSGSPPDAGMDAGSASAASAPVDTEAAPPEPKRCVPEPKVETRSAKLPAADELLRLVKEEPRALGSASIGSPTRGSLWGGVEMKDSEGILRAGGYGWGTETVVRSIERAVREVRRCHPGAPRLYVGDIARERGGWLRPHRSHQSGLDADIGYYYRTASVWYQRATAGTLDVARTWALVRAIIEGGNVDMIFMDLSVQRVLRAYIETLPEGDRPPADLFESPAKKDTIIRHAWGHATHFHVRFTDPRAVELGQRLKSALTRFPK